jgi:glycerol-3-phosphate dehydrogenase
MWQTNWRDGVWSQLGQPWDVIIVGGGITGAGVLRAATGLGLRALLVEAKDFAWGTSSRSTKLVHGGLRYLAQGQFGVTRESVQERERLIKEGPGLVDWLGFLMPVYEGSSTSKRKVAVALAAYDWFARKWQHRYFEHDDFLMLAPHVGQEGLRGGWRYYDAVTDDARLVLRVIREAVRAGGTAINYARAQELLFGSDGQVAGAVLRDGLAERQAEVHARAVVNATGPWADGLRAKVGGEPRIRPSRGSHLTFPSWRLPVAQAINLVHPRDGRLVFVLPWEGVTVAGTTDLDHHQPVNEEPSMTAGEVQYLMEALHVRFPALALRADDAIASFAGVRPIVGTGKGDPSKESRRHVVLEEEGLVTIAGGKLTTFRPMAWDTLQAVRRLLPDMSPAEDDMVMLDAVQDDLPDADGLDEGQWRRLLGRYGADAPALVAAAREKELEPIQDTPYLWAELRWAARNEAVIHLDDLLLRRVRLGLLLPEGALPIMERVRAVAQPELGWDDERWDVEAARYADVWRRAYGVPVR